MITCYKYIRFHKSQVSNGREWLCCNRKTEFVLGRVIWWEDWHQYVFEPNIEEETIHNATCLRDIADFLAQLAPVGDKE